jgi:hypothetical protein
VSNGIGGCRSLVHWPPTNCQQVILMGGVMGYAQKRLGRGGKPRYTAVYHDLRGERRSAGTFSGKKDANAAWQGLKRRPLRAG